MKLSQLAGRVVRMDTEIIVIFKVQGKYYPATDENSELFESYLHTGNEDYLLTLTNEMEY